MTTLYIALSVGPDYNVQHEAFRTEAEARACVCEWLDEYGYGGPDEQAEEAKRQINAGETGYMGDGEHWYEVRPLFLQEPAPPAELDASQSEAIAQADAYATNAGLPAYSALLARGA